jgi:hypothetical protein
MEHQRSQQHDPGEEHLPPSRSPDHPAPTPRLSRWDAAAVPVTEAPAPPPVWTRYIESRLRQFDCEGR